MGNAFTSGYVPINFWVRQAWKTPVLLAGYWDDSPRLATAIVVESIVQILLGVLGIVLVLVPMIKLGILNFPWSFDLLPKTFPMGVFVLIPLLTAFWEIVLGGMHLALVYTWFGAPFMATVYIHSQIELWLLLYRILLMYGLQYNQKLTAGSFIAMSSWTTITLLLYMTTSNLGIQGTVAGTAFLSDFALLFGIPITFVVLSSRYQKVNFNEIGQDAILTGLMLIHIFEYYIQMFMVLADSSPFTIMLSGNFLTFFAYCNLFVYSLYIRQTYACTYRMHLRLKADSAALSSSQSRHPDKEDDGLINNNNNIGTGNDNNFEESPKLPTTVPWYHTLYWSSGFSGMFLWFMVGFVRTTVESDCPIVNQEMKLSNVLLSQIVGGILGVFAHLGMCYARYYGYKIKGNKPKQRSGLGSLVLLCNVVAPLVMFPWVGYVIIGLSWCASFQGPGVVPLILCIIVQIGVFLILLVVFIYRYYHWFKNDWLIVFFTVYDETL